MNAPVPTELAAAHAEIAELRQRIDFLEWQALSMSTFAKVMERADIVLFSMDPKGVTTMSDGKGLERLGHKPGERVGKNELEATRGTPAHACLLRALAGEAVRATVEPVPGVFFDTWYMPLRNENNEADGVLGMAIDATPRVQADRQVALKTKVIEEQVATIRDLASPIIKVWDEVLCLPIIGAVDAARASEMMENLLESIVREEGAVRDPRSDRRGGDGHVDGPPHPAHLRRCPDPRRRGRALRSAAGSRPDGGLARDRPRRPAHGADAPRRARLVPEDAADRRREARPPAVAAKGRDHAAVKRP